MLATDLNNTEFSGAISNPDALLFVEFFMHEQVDKWGSEEASAKEGRRVTKKLPPAPFVRIMRPGDQTSIIETPVREEHKARWPEKWMYFQMSEGLVSSEMDIPGYKLEEWDYLNDKPELLRDLKYMRFQTVEHVAGASDTQVQRMGLGSPGIREQARAGLRKKLSAEMQAQIAEKDAKLAELQANDIANRERLEKLEAALAAQAPVERKKPGPKPKEEVIG